MITWLKNNGSPVLFFNEEHYRNNIQNNWTWISFTSWYTEFTAKYKLKSDSYIIPEENYFVNNDLDKTVEAIVSLMSKYIKPEEW